MNKEVLLAALAADSPAPDVFATACAADADDAVREAAARHPACPVDALARLARDSYQSVRRAARR